MNAFAACVMQAFLLAAALSVDTFAACFAYGAEKIRIPFSSVLVISGVCSAILAVSLLLGRVLLPMIPDSVTHIICFLLLLMLGLIKLFDSSLKALIRRHANLRRQLRFSILSLHFILDIYADPEKADCDRSRSLSSAEAAALAVALSLDGLAAGFGAGLSAPGIAAALMFSMLMGVAAVLIGSLAGRRLAERSSLNLSWLGGAILILLAFLKL